MTGRELIVYILQNNLEDVDIFADGKICGFMTLSETATKFNVGISTVATWVKLDMIDHVYIGGTVYIPANVECPIKGGN